MNLKDRQKMCSQCDGRIPYEAEQCPYCGVDQTKTLGQSLAGISNEQHNRSLQESLASPYSTTSSKSSTAAASLNLSKMSSLNLDKKNPSFAQTASASTAAVDTSEQASTSAEGNRAFLPILLLCLGGNLMTIGLLLLLFSHEGVLRLEWDASYWFAYCLGAVPLLVFGLKKASQSD